MYTGAESIEHINVCRQELDRQIDRIAREIEVQKILAVSDPDREADQLRVRLSALANAIATRLRPVRRIEEPSGS